MSRNSAVPLGRVLRGGIRDTLQLDYTRTARSLGTLERSVVLRHSFETKPTLSIAGLQVGLMFAGTVLVESIVAGLVASQNFLALGQLAGDLLACVTVTWSAAASVSSLRGR